MKKLLTLFLLATLTGCTSMLTTLTEIKTGLDATASIGVAAFKIKCKGEVDKCVKNASQTLQTSSFDIPCPGWDKCNEQRDVFVTTLEQSYQLLDLTAYASSAKNVEEAKALLEKVKTSYSGVINLVNLYGLLEPLKKGKP